MGNPLLDALEEERRRSNPLLRALDEERERKAKEEAEGPGIADRIVGGVKRSVEGISRAFAPEDDDSTVTSAAKATVRGLGSALATASPLANVGRTVAGIHERAKSGEAERDFAKDEGFIERAGDLMERGIASTAGGVATTVGGLTGSKILKDDGDTFRSTAGRALAGEQTWDDLKADFSFKKLGQYVAEQSIQSVPEMAMLLSGVGVGISAAGRTGNIAADRAENNYAEGVTAKDVLLSSGFGAASAVLDRFGLDKILKPVGANALVRIVKAGGAEAGTEFLQGIIENAGGTLGTEVGFDLMKALDEGAAGAVAGFGMGAGISGTVEAGSAADKFRARRQGAPEQPGAIDQAGREAATLTPEDEASALPNDLIAEGKKAIAENDAALAADERLEAAGLPRLKSAIEIVDADGNAVRGTVEDVFDGGFKLQTGEGTTLDYYLDDINDAGDTIRPLLTAEEINAEAAARADAAKAEMERLRQEAANRPAEASAQDTPLAPRVEAPTRAPSAQGERTPVEDGVGVARSIFGDKARITSGYRGPDHALSKKNPNSWHAKSRAAVDMAPIPGMTFDQAKAAIEGQGYTLIEAINETGKGKTKHATGDHWHFVIGKGGAPVGGAPAGGVNVGDIAAIQQREDDEENAYTKALEDYRKQGETEGEGAPAPFTADAPPIPDDPTRPDPASVYAQQNVTPDAEATSPADGIGGGPPQPGGDAAAPISGDIRGEPIDKEWRRFKPESGTIEIARDDMPQIKAEHRGAMVNFLKARGIASEEASVPATALKPTQAEFSEVKVQKAKEYEGGNRAILVSSDGHVLDGHHQWLAARDNGEEIRIIRLDAPVREIINTVRDMPSATTAEGGDIPAVVDQPLTTSPVADRAGAVGETQTAGSVLKPVTALKVGDTLDYGGEQLRVERMDGDRPVLSDGTALAPGGPPKRVVVGSESSRAGGVEAEQAANETPPAAPRAPIPTRPGRPEDERVNRDVAISPTGREAPVEYRVAELGDIVASHTPDGAVNPAFPAERQPRERDSSASRIQVAKIAGNLNPRLLGRNVLASDGAPIVSQGGIVEAGNGRIAALDLAYQQFPDKAQAYRDYLKQEGFDVEGMERPVLVRVLDPSVSAEDAFALTRESNQRSTAEMSVTEQAAIDAEKLTDDLVNAYRGGSPTAPANVEFVKRYFEEVADPNARATLYDDDGKMTQAAQARITAALLQRAFGNRELVKDVAESTDPDVKAIGNVLSDVAGMWARMKAAAGNGTIDPQFDITENINEAVSIVAQARKTKRNVAEFVAQNGIFTGKIPARTEAVLRMMFRNPNFTRPTGQAPLKQMFEWYIEQAMQSSGLFASPDATPDATLSQAREKTLGEGIDVEPDAGRPGDERVRGSVREGGSAGERADARVPEQRGTPGEGEGQSDLTPPEGYSFEDLPSGGIQLVGPRGVEWAWTAPLFSDASRRSVKLAALDSLQAKREPSSDTDVEGATTAEAAAPPPPSAAASADSSRSAFEATAKSPPEPGKPFIVYRVGDKTESLEGRNAGDAFGVAEHLARFDDAFAPGHGQKLSTLFMYEVTVDKPFGKYERALRGNLQGANNEDTVGLADLENRLIYSFGESGYTARLIGKVPLDDVRAKLKDLSGHDNFDDSGWALGAEAIRAALPVFKAQQQAAAPASESLEDKLAAKIAADFDAARAEYAAIDGDISGSSEGGRILNTDLARELSPEYRADRSRSAEVHEPASQFVKDLYARMLAEPVPEGRSKVVMFTAGGTGAGKSTGMKLIPESETAAIVYDTNMNGLDSAVKKIEQAIAAGWRVRLLYTYRDPLEALENGALPRAERMGRTVPIEAHIETHVESRATVAELARRYANDPRVDVSFADNSRGRNNAALVSLEELPTIDDIGLDEKAEQLVRSAYEAGRISEATFRGTLGERAEGIRRAPQGGEQDRRAGDRGQPQPQRGGERPLTPVPAPSAPQVSPNKAFTEDAYQAAKRRMAERKRRLNSGVDPEMLLDAVIMAGYHVEKGARTFAAYADAFLADMQEAGWNRAEIIPHLRQFYENVRYDPRTPKDVVSGMSGPEDIGAALARLESEPAGGISEADADATAAQAPRGDDRASDDGSRAGDAPRVEADGDAGAGSEPAGRGGTRDVRDDDGRGDDREQQGEPQSDGGRGGSDAAAGQRGGNRDRAGDRVRRKSADRGTDYLAPRGSLKRAGSWKATAERNLDVIELVNRLDAEGRAATPDEQKQLAAFTGWGASEIANGLLGNVARKSDGTRELRTHSYGAKTEWNPLIERAQKLLTGEMLETALQSTQYAHYTSEEVIRSIWDGMERLGFTGGRILEPGMGNGLFAVAAPGEVMGASNYTGIEMDAFTAKVAGYLLPQENVLADDYTKVKLPDGFFDVAIGNPPFANIKILDDPAYKKHRFSLHDYFFAKSIDKVRPGGLMVFVTSRYTMDKQDAKARQYLADRADLLGAIRLPQTAFKENAGTEVVTDVLFFQRRAPGQEPGGQAWLGLKSVKAGTEKVMVNEYFAVNPKMVLGKHATTGSMYRANEYTVEPMASMSIEKAFARAIEALPQDVYTAAPKAAKEAAEAKTFERDFAPASTKEGGLYLKDGALMVVEDGSGVPLEVKPSEAAWLKDYVPLRDALKQAQKDQLQDGDWEKSLKALNKAYDAFAKKHGPISAFTTSERRTVDEDGEETVVEIRRYKNKRLLAYDVESPLVTQLERVTDEGKIERGPFLAGRTLNKPTRPEIATVQDALAVTLDEIGRLDLDYIGKQLGLTREQVIEDLGDSIYEAPDGIWQTEDEYLSGNVVEKLEEAEKAAAVDARFERNVKALMARQPTPLAYSDINVKLGVGWIKPEYVGQFARDVLGENPGPISYNQTLGTWEVDGASNRFRRNDTNEYGTSDRSPLELLDALLNNRTIKITRTDSDKKTYVDATATVAAVEAAKKISERFKTWIWEDGTRAGELADYYNRNFNNLAPRQFNGDHLTLPGLAAKFAANTHPHVKRAVWRQIQTGNTYLAHAVGAGKTREMIIGGMEQKRLGLIKKPMYVVPNHMLEQFRAEFLEAYPAANLLVADEQAFHTDNRKRFMAQAALNDPDAIIVTHSSFGKIDTSDEARAAVVQDLIGELEAAAEELGNDRSVMHTRKKIERQIEQIRRRFAGKIGTGKDRALTFEEMGVDFLYIDEAHEFRKLDFATNRTAKGIDPVGSQKALDLFIKIRWLESQRPGRSVVLASGTPVTNTMAELFTVMRYMAKDQLDRDGIGSFDGWAAMFGEVAAGYEQNAAGGYEIVERFAKFVNVPELMKRVRTFMDVLTSDQLGDLVKRPKVNGGVPHSEVVPASEALEAYMKLELDARLKKSRAWKPSKEQPGNPDPVINIISDARLSAIDMRFVRPGGKPDPNSKLNRMLDKIVERYKATRDLEYTSASGGKDLRKGGVQIVFSAVGFGEAASRNRGFNLREWVDGQLVAGGIKKAEIAWMSDANTHAKKAQLQKDVRAGKIAVLIGSPKNMGTGLNVQKRLTDLHYLSPPWYPSDVEQPHGRIIRQGNENPEVDIWWYAAKGTYDSTAWGMVSRKQKFIEQALTGDNSVRVLEDISESSQYEMAAALAAGDERIIQVAGLSAEVDRLQRLEQAHADNQRQLRRNIRDLDKHGIPSAQERVKAYEEAQKVKAGIGTEPFSLTVGGKTYDKPGEAGAALIDAATEATRGAVQVKRAEIGKLRGKLPIVVEPFRIGGPDRFMVSVEIGTTAREIAGPLSTKELLPFEGVDPVGMVRKAENALASVTGSLAEARKLLEARQAERAANEKRLGAPFAEAGVLAEKVAERAQLQAELAAESKAKEAVGKGAGPAATPIESRPDLFDEPAQPTRTMTEAQRAELEARQKQGMARRGGQQGLGDQEGGLFASERDQGTLFRVSDGEPATRRNLKDLERDLNARLEKIAGKRVQLRITDRIGMAGAGSVNIAPDGRYKPSMKLIEVASDALHGSTFTLDHEAVHALRDLGAFSPTDWMILKNAARKDAKLWASIQRRYADLHEEAQLEEAVADMFAQFQEAGDILGKLGRAIAVALTKALKVLEAIRESLRGNGFAIRRTAGDVMLDMRAGRTKADIGKYETGNAHNKASESEALESRPPLAPVLDLAGTDPTFKGKMADAFELFRMKTQDRYITLKKAQRKIERVLGRPLPDSMDVYKGEELMHGRMAERIDRLHEKLVRPLFDAMADANVSLDELETFLYARHARERNAQIAKINPDMPDGGSGMTNTAARAILNRVARSDKADAMNALAARVDAIRESTLDAQVEYGLISAKQAAEYRATYQAYVPLRGFKEMAADPNADPAKTARVNRSGGGINVRGPESKRAFGRRSEADSPLSYLILQAQEAIVRGETNRVGQQLYELAKNAKDGEFWTINKPTTARKLNEETGLVEEYTHHQLTAADAPYTVVVKVEGKERRVTFNRDNPAARRMADAMRRLSDSQMDWFTKSFGVVNRWLSAVNTRWNAEFVFTNMFRDLQTAAINLQGIDVPGIAKKSAKHYAWALKASMKGAYGKGDQWYDEFVMEGAKTAFARIENIDDLKKDLSAEFAMAQSRAGTDKSLGLKGKRAFRRVVDIVENANDGVENAARLAAYRAAREAGVSKKQAASIAKNLTVNFNRRGQFGPVMNSLYLFYNASVQGNVRILQAMYHSKKVRGVVAGIAVAGFMSEFLNAMLSDDDDDGESFYDKIPAFEKERNMIVMLDGENYITIPMPWGYNVFYEAGRVAAEVARRGGQRWEESASHLATTMLGAFNPIGFSWEGRSAQEALVSLIMPSALDPVVDLSQNRDFTGRPIMPEENQFGPQDPDFRRYWPGVDKKWKAVTDFLNDASGGNKVEAGYVDVSPETLDYLAHTALGAAGALADRLIGLPAKTLAGEATREDIPLVRKAFGEKSPYRDKSEFYARMNEVEAKVKDGTDLIEAEMWGELDAFKADHERVLQMQPIAKEAKKVMRQIRKDRRANDGWLEKGQIDEATHADNDARLDEIESTVVTNFNRQWVSVVYGRDTEAR